MEALVGEVDEYASEPRLLTIPVMYARANKCQITIGIAGPITLNALTAYLRDGDVFKSSVQVPILTNLIVELLRREHRVEVFTLSTSRVDVGTYRDDRLVLHVGFCRPRFRWCDAFRSEREQLRRAMRESNCDIIHAHWTYEYALAALAAGKPALVTVHDWGPVILKHHPHPYRLIRLAMQATTLMKAPHLTANSPYIAEKVRRYYRRKPVVIPNGVALPSTTLPKEPPSGGFTLGALNNGFGRRKNTHTLIEAFAVVRSSMPNSRLYLGGEDHGRGGPAYEWARKRKLADGVHFLGAIPASAVPPFMASLDLFVHPSLEESFGMVLIEALAQGTPVVGGRHSGAVPWVLGDGLAGSLVDVSSAGALAEEILRLARDPIARAQMARAGLDHVARNFALERVVDAYEACYREVLAGQASRSR